MSAKILISVGLVCGCLGAVNACGSGSEGNGTSCEQGAEQCECYGNLTCDAGLQCFSFRCVDVNGSEPEGGRGSGSGGGGGAAQEGGAGLEGDGAGDGAGASAHAGQGNGATSGSAAEGGTSGSRPEAGGEGPGNSGSAGMTGGGIHGGGTGGVTGESGAPNSAGTTGVGGACSNEGELISSCDGSTATRCTEGAAQASDCRGCGIVGCSGEGCCADVSAIVLDRSTTARPDLVTDFSYSEADSSLTATYLFEHASQEGLITWTFTRPQSATTVHVSAEALDTETWNWPYLTLESTGSGCMYVVSDGVAQSASTCWGDTFSKQSVEWLTVRVRATGAGSITLRVFGVEF